ncbi:hypothetical protein BGW42_000502 [Actinomortierella wolfii]|nr:hypothetical protein BGW42_000502 [Actinomortierella wolfii]
MAVFFDSALDPEGDQVLESKVTAAAANADNTTWDSLSWHPSHSLQSYQTTSSIHHGSSPSDTSSSSDESSTINSTFTPSHKHSLSQGSSSSDTTTVWGESTPSPPPRKGSEPLRTNNDKGLLPLQGREQQQEEEHQQQKQQHQQLQQQQSGEKVFSEDFELSTKDYINWLISSTDHEDEGEDEDEDGDEDEDEDGDEDEEKQPSWMALENSPPALDNAKTASTPMAPPTSHQLQQQQQNQQQQPVIDLVKDDDEDKTAMAKLQELLGFNLAEPSLAWPWTTTTNNGATTTTTTTSTTAAAALTEASLPPPNQPLVSAQPFASMQQHPFQNGRFNLTQHMPLWPYPHSLTETQTTISTTATTTPSLPNYTLVDNDDKDIIAAKKAKRKNTLKKVQSPFLSSSTLSSSSPSSSAAAAAAVLGGSLPGSVGGHSSLLQLTGTTPGPVTATTLTPPLPRSLPNPGYHPTNTNHAHTPVFQPHLAHNHLHQLSFTQLQTPFGSNDGSGGGHALPPGRVGVSLHPLTRRASMDGSLSSLSSSMPFVHPGFYSLTSQVKNVPRPTGTSTPGCPVATDANNASTTTATTMTALVQPPSSLTNKSGRTLSEEAIGASAPGQQQPLKSVDTNAGHESLAESNNNNSGGSSSNSMLRKRKSIDQTFAPQPPTPFTPSVPASSSPMPLSSTAPMEDRTTCGSVLSSSSPSSVSSSSSSSSSCSSSSSSSSSSSAASVSPLSNGGSGVTLTQSTATPSSTAAVIAAAAASARGTGGVPRGQPFVAAFPVQSPEHSQLMRMLQLGCGEQVRGGLLDTASSGSSGGNTGDKTAAGGESRKKSKILASPLGLQQPSNQSQYQQQHQQQQAQDLRGSIGQAYDMKEWTGGSGMTTKVTAASVSTTSSTLTPSTVTGHPTNGNVTMNNIYHLHQQLNQGLGLCSISPSVPGSGVHSVTAAGMRLPLAAPETSQHSVINSKQSSTAATSTNTRHAAPSTSVHSSFHHYPQTGIPPPLMSSRPPSYVPPPGYLESQTGGYFSSSTGRRASPSLQAQFHHTASGGVGRGGVGGGSSSSAGVVGSYRAAHALGGGTGGSMTRKPNPAEVPPSVLPADFFVLEEAVLARRRASTGEVFRR